MVSFNSRLDGESYVAMLHSIHGNPLAHRRSYVLAAVKSESTTPLPLLLGLFESIRKDFVAEG